MHGRTRRWDTALPGRVDAVVALVVLAVAELETALASRDEPRWLFVAVAVVITAPLAWRRIAPVTVCLFVFSMLVAMDLAGHPLDAAYLMATLILALYAVGAYRDRRAAVLGWAAAMALLAGLILVESGPGAGDFIFVASIVTGAWALGVVVRSRGEENAVLAARTSHLEQEQETLVTSAVGEERARIARELHDVIAHSVSIVVVQTAAVRRQLQRDRPDEAAQLEAVEKTARQAMQEMRRLLGILRTTDDAIGFAPQPGLGDLDALVDQLRESGLPVQLRVEGRPRPLPAGLDLTAYRVVQEALVNALKHAGGASASVVTSYTDTELTLHVTDTGSRRPAPIADSGGHGLIGMRERVQLYGGQLRCGPEPGGGFSVHARLPLAAT